MKLLLQQVLYLDAFAVDITFLWWTAWGQRSWMKHAWGWLLPLGVIRQGRPVPWLAVWPLVLQQFLSNLIEEGVWEWWACWFCCRSFTVLGSRLGNGPFPLAIRLFDHSSWKHFLVEPGKDFYTGLPADSCELLLSTILQRLAAGLS